MKDKALEELFLAQRPHFDDKDEFMARLTRKLDAVEYLRQYEEANLRRYRYAMVAVFVAGIVVGGALLALVLSTPSELPLFTFHATSGILLAIEQYSRPAAFNNGLWHHQHHQQHIGHSPDESINKPISRLKKDSTSVGYPLPSKPQRHLSTLRLFYCSPSTNVF